MTGGLPPISEEEADFYKSASFFAATAIVEAHGQYSPTHPVAERYFGVGHNTTQVEAMLRTMIDLAYSGEIVYSCEGRGPGSPSLLRHERERGLTPG